MRYLACRAIFAALAGMLVCARAVPAQVGGGYDLSRNTVDGGGATFSVGGSYTLGGTIGQPDAGSASGGPYLLAGGFWPAIAPAPIPTPTVTAAVTHTAPAASATPTRTSALQATTTPTQTATGGASPASTPTRSPSAPTPSGSVTATPTPSPTAAPPACPGDCDADGSVTVDEIIRGVNIALGTLDLSACSSFDTDGDGAVTVDELVRAVNLALNGCAEG
jgi:hypothetical protein